MPGVFQLNASGEDYSDGLYYPVSPGQEGRFHKPLYRIIQLFN